MKTNKISIIIILSIFILFILVCQKNDVIQNNNQSLNNSKNIIKKLEKFNSIEGEQEGQGGQGQSVQENTNSDFIRIEPEFTTPLVFVNKQLGGNVTIYWSMPDIPDHYYSPNNFKVELIKEGVGQSVQDYSVPEPKCSNCSMVLDNLEAGTYSIKIAIVYLNLFTNEKVSTPFTEIKNFTVESIDSISNKQYRNIILQNIRENERRADQLTSELRQNSKINQIKKYLDMITRQIYRI